MLIPGGGLGGWLWRKVTPFLRGASHDVYTPTQTGVGERAHLLTPEVGLHTHIQDVLAVLECEELTDVVLVGHSYAGMIITGVADRAPERISQLIYLDAVVPYNGESQLDVNPQRISEVLRRFGDGVTVSVDRSDADPDRTFIAGQLHAADYAWYRRHKTPYPVKALTERLEFQHPAALEMIPKTYVYYSRRRRPRPEPYASRIADFASKGNYREIDASHLGMVSHPRETAEVLLELARLDLSRL